MTDQLHIEGLQLSTRIGAYAWEHAINQSVVLDMTIAVAIKDAAEQDDLACALDYASLVEQLSTFVEQQNCQLIECLAERIASFLFEKFEINHIHLRLAKPGAIPQAKTVAVSIEREKSSYQSQA